MIHAKHVILVVVASMYVVLHLCPPHIACRRWTCKASSTSHDTALQLTHFEVGKKKITT
jgi:hypothetical protein